MYARILTVVLSLFFYFLNTFNILQTVCNVTFLLSEKKFKEKNNLKDFGLCPSRKTEFL